LLPNRLLPIQPPTTRSPAARPFFSVVGRKMENHRNLRDFLSQGCSSSTSRNRTGHEAPEDDDFVTFSQSSFALPPRINVPALHSRIEALDLNSQSQDTDFLYLSSYQDVLQSGDGGSDLDLSPLGHGRSTHTLFQSARSSSAPISHARGAFRGCRGVRGRGTSSRGGGRYAISAPIDPVLIEDFEMNQPMKWILVLQW
jgi:hypothetical protein